MRKAVMTVVMVAAECVLQTSALPSIIRCFEQDCAGEKTGQTGQQMMTTLATLATPTTPKPTISSRKDGGTA